MGTPEIDHTILQSIMEAVSKELLYAHGTAATSDSSTDAALTLEKLKDSYTDFQYKYTRDIWNGLLERRGGHTRMLAVGRESAVEAIESELDMSKKFRPNWLIVSRNAPQEYGLTFFRCICLCHGDGQAHELGRFETQHGDWCCSCSKYEDI